MKTESEVIMKKLFYFSVHPLTFLTAIPPAVLLWLATRYNDVMTIPGKLYPLMVALSLWIIFTFIYFFRGLLLCDSSFLAIGPFSSHGSAAILVGKTVILRKCPHGVKKIEVLGSDGETALDFLKDREPQEISQMRETFYAPDGAILRIAALFGVPKETADAALSADTFREETEDYLLSAEKMNEIREIRITVKTEKTQPIPEKKNDGKYHFRFFDR